MNTIPLSEWRTAYASALFARECGPWQERVKEAFEKIDESVQTLSQQETIERMSIEAARKSLAVLTSDGRSATRTREPTSGMTFFTSGFDFGLC
jgi:hypothetical protein